MDTIMDMFLRKCLSTQLNERMRKRPDLDTQTKLSKAANVTQSTVWRVLNEEVGASIDVVEQIAFAFRVPAIHLLADPLQSQLLSQWEHLGEDDRQKVLAFMAVVLMNKKSS